MGGCRKKEEIYPKRFASNSKFTYEQFSTLLIWFESVLNSLSLSTLIENTEELFSLTSSDFLRGAPIIALSKPPKEPPTENLNFIRRWNHLRVFHISSLKTLIWEKIRKYELQQYKFKIPHFCNRIKTFQ